MFLKINGIDLYYDIQGSGKEKLLLMHGNGEDSNTFSCLVDSLKETNKYTIYLVDSRNHGKSSRVESLSYVDIAFDIAVLIKKLKLNDLTVLGFSDGAIVALYLAMKFDCNLKKIILCGVNANPYGLKGKVLRGIRKDYKATGSINSLLMLREPYFSKTELREIKIPTLLIVGENDVVKLNHTKMIHDCIKDSELIVLKNEDHCSYVMNSDKLKSYL